MRSGVAPIPPPPFQRPSPSHSRDTRSKASIMGVLTVVCRVEVGIRVFYSLIRKFDGDRKTAPIRVGTSVLTVQRSYYTCRCVSVRSSFTTHNVPLLCVWVLLFFFFFFQVPKQVGKKVTFTEEPIYQGYVYCNLKMSPQVREFSFS